MCDPVTAAVATSAAISVGSTIMEHRAQGKKAEAERKAATTDRNLQIRDLTIRQQEETLATRQAIATAKDQATQARSATKVSAAEAGVTGSSLKLLIQGIDRDEVVNEQTNLDNIKTTIAQLERMKQGVDATAANRIAAAPNPSKLATGIRIGAITSNATLGEVSRRSRIG